LSRALGLTRLGEQDQRRRVRRLRREREVEQDERVRIPLERDPAALSPIQRMTTIVWPTMYCGVPQKRAACSAPRPKAS
jgi:hypothetical protein